MADWGKPCFCNNQHSSVGNKGNVLLRMLPTLTEKSVTKMQGNVSVCSFSTQLSPWTDILLHLEILNLKFRPDKRLGYFFNLAEFLKCLYEVGPVWVARLPNPL